MDENITDAIEFASTDNIADMQSSIQSALQSKIVDALEAKRIEVAQSFMQKANESTEPFDDFEEEDLEEARSHRDVDYDDEGWGVENPRLRKTMGNHDVHKAPTSSTKIYHRVQFPQEDKARAEGMKYDGRWYHTDPKKSDDSQFQRISVRESHSTKHKGELKGNQFKLDKNKNGKLDSNDFKLLKKESHLEEKLSVSDGISAWIKDFVHSDNPRFEGKSKEERRQMAMAAFYDAKKQQNEEYVNINGKRVKNTPEDKLAHVQKTFPNVKKIDKNGNPVFDKSKFNDAQKNEEYVSEAKRLISTHGDGVHTAKVYKDPEYNEYQVHYFKNGKHMGEGPVSYHDDKNDAVSTAKHETNRMNSNVSESAPSSGLSAKQKSEVVKKAKAGKDIGKKGKGFEKVLAKAKKYGAEDPKAVAAAAMWKNIKR